MCELLCRGAAPLVAGEEDINDISIKAGFMDACGLCGERLDLCRRSGCLCARLGALRVEQATFLFVYFWQEVRSVLIETDKCLRLPPSAAKHVAGSNRK